LRNGAALAPRKAMIKRLPLDSAIDLEFRRPGGTTASEIQIKTVCTPPSSSLACPRLRCPLRKPPRDANIGIKALRAAHAGLRGRLFEHIVRHTWRIAASAERPELAGSAGAGARLARVRHL